jgi:hypothetical protein
MESEVLWFENKEYIQLYREWASKVKVGSVSHRMMDREFGIAYHALQHPPVVEGVGFVIEDSIKFAVARLKYRFSYTELVKI